MSPKLKRLTLAALISALPAACLADGAKYRNPFPGFNPQCYADVPAIDDRQFDAMTTPVDILSDSVSTSDKNHISFLGDVSLTQGNRTLSAGQTSYDRSLNRISASGNIRYRDGYITIKDASELETSLDSQVAMLSDPEYVLHGSPAHGNARKVVYNHKDGKYHFENAKITTCPKSDETWYLTASTVDVDSNEVFGEAWNTTLWFYDVPVFYLPYFNFPIKNQRKTGLLYPSIEYGKSDGIQLGVPFYWNIAPNYDYTITPKLYTRRGLQTLHEFRYMLSPNHGGVLDFEYINHDRKAAKDDSYYNNRWFLTYRHHSDFLNRKLAVDIDYNRVNSRDYNYFNDLGNISGSNDKLLQNVAVTYRPYRFTTVGLEARNYQMLIDTDFMPFAILPKLSVRNMLPFEHFSVNSYFEAANFAHTGSRNQHGDYRGQRVHLESGLKVPVVQQPFLQIDGSFRFMYTRYQQDQDGRLMPYLQNRGFTGFDTSADRFLPEIKLRARLILDTDFNLFGASFSQSLEPHIQYLYVPYRNQDRIGLYDTTDYIQDYYTLFQSNRYAGLDRISNENRLSLGFTTKLTDQEGHQRALLTVGQAYSFEDQKVGLYPASHDNLGSRSNFNMMLEMRPAEHLHFASSMAYDTLRHHVYRGFAAMEYRDDSLTAQLNYRYTRLGNRTMFDTRRIDLKQMGGHLSLPVNDSTSLMMSAFYDLEQKRNIDRIVKLQYSNCCWKFNVFLEQVNEPDNISLKAREDTKFGLQFEMKGLGSLGGKDLEHNLNTRLLPYNRPFNISE
ncbi:MAG: LPS assembly protein LptD [Succinivibrionaceae bacterium]|nr:LPS assembly protein LptD [Succinivibrionaceae bacterium]